jgi:hypothetical protein
MYSHKISPLLSSLRQMNLSHTFPFCYFKITLIFSSHVRSVPYSGHSSACTPTKNCGRPACRQHARLMHPVSTSLWTRVPVSPECGCLVRRQTEELHWLRDVNWGFNAIDFICLSSHVDYDVCNVLLISMQCTIPYPGHIFILFHVADFFIPESVYWILVWEIGAVRWYLIGNVKEMWGHFCGGPSIQY